MKRTQRAATAVALLLVLLLVQNAGLLARAEERPAGPAAPQRAQVFLHLVANARPPAAQQPLDQSDQALIAAGLAAGKIDYGTSLLYRAYALFADPRLPAAYQGAGSEGQDHTLFEEMADPSLPPDIQAALRPFRLRPAHPESIHSIPRSTSTVADSPTMTTAAGDIWCEQHRWASLRSSKPAIAIAVHAYCGWPGAEADMRQTLAILESLWGPMTSLMRTPIGDVGGQPGSPDDSIDFYLVEPLGAVWCDGTPGSIRKTALHTTVQAPPMPTSPRMGSLLRCAVRTATNF